MFCRLRFLLATFLVFAVCLTGAAPGAYAAESNAAIKEDISLTAKTDAEDPETVFNTFYEAVKGMDTDSNFDTLWSYYEMAKNRLSVRFEESCGGDREVFLSLPRLEMFMLYELYVNPVVYSGLGDYNGVFGTLDKYHSSVASTAYSLLSRCGQAEADAYLAIMDWQYAYFLENGKFYNFFTDIINTEPDPVVDDGEPDDPVPPEEDQPIVFVPAGGADSGIWGKFISSVKNNALTILILLVLAGALGGLVIYRKRKTIDDESDE